VSKEPREVLRRTGLVLLVLLGLLAARPAGAAEPAGNAPDNVRRFVELLDDPAVRSWLRDELAAREGGTEPPAAPAEAAPRTLQAFLAESVASLRAHGAARLAAAADLPAELAHAFARVRAELHGSGVLGVALLVLAFAAAGYLCEHLFLRATRRFRHAVLRSEGATPVQRLATVGLRLMLAMLAVAAYAVGSIGAFTVLAWPPLLKQIVLTVLAGLVLIRGAWIVTRLVIAPGHPQRRLLPLSETSASFLHRWANLLAAAMIGSWLLVHLLLTLGVAAPAADLVATLLGLAVAALLILAAWRAVPHIRAYRVEGQAVTLAERTWGSDDYIPIGLSVLLPLAWLIWTLGDGRITATILLLVALPAAVWTARQIIEHVVTPSTFASRTEPPGPIVLLVERGARSLLIVGGALLLLSIWGIGIAGLAGPQTMSGRLLGGVVKALLIVLLADLGLQMVRIVLDRWLLTAGEFDDPGQAGRRARLLTLAPIIRNVMLIVISVMALLTVLSSLGVQIGPLLAGAGVVGIAVGFGAQTLVKDIIAGFFFLLDDAFRVGEYIESGSYKGTVEAFSLRSVKLRHHRGPLYTVPFGSLGAIVNHSRDWVIDRLYVNVTYDTDLERVKKIVKAIGKELAADPEFAPDILQPLKMQGVDEMGDFAIRLRLKTMTRPGRQFTHRRRAYAKIKQAFAAEGIGFAVPTVHVRGGEGDGAAAQTALAALDQKAASA
jgi:small-conductance mechanosensitive channel